MINTVKPKLASHQNHPQLSAELEVRLALSKKMLLTKVILPVFLVTSFFLMISHWGSDQRSLTGVGVLTFIVVFNAFLSNKNGIIKTAWGKCETRSDEVDTVRWLINFILDMFLVWSLDVHSTAIVMVWLLLTLGAMADIQKKRNKLFITAVALVTFCTLVIYFYSLDIKTLIYLISCYLALVLIFWKLESYLVQEIALFLIEREQRELIETEALKIQREAAIGNSTRAISHELNNLIGAAQLSTELLRDPRIDQQKELERLDKVLSYMTKISSLVLDDLGKESVTKRRISLADLKNDIRLLLCVGFNEGIISIIIDFPVDADQCFFEERAGSTYLIIHNLVKNACEAIIEEKSQQPNGVIKIIARKGNDSISISVEDNGPGISEEQHKSIESGTITSSKNRCHGLGLKFVKKECLLNGFILTHEFPDDIGCCFNLSL